MLSRSQGIATLACLFIATTTHAAIFTASGSDDDCTKSKSTAGCIMDLADLPDGPPDSTAKRIFFPNNSSSNETVDTAMRGAGSIVALGEMAGIIGAASGFARAGGALNLLDALFVGRPRVSPKFIAVLPSSAVKDGDPGRTVEDALVAAVTNLLKGMGADRAELVTSEHKHLFGVNIRRVYKFRGGKCEQSDCRLNSQFLDTDKTKVGDKITLPGWLGHKEDAFLWSKHPKQVYPSIRIDGKYVPHSLPVLLYLSASMPNWYYIYVPADEGRLLPFVLNQGKLLWFFEPGAKPDALPTDLSIARPKKDSSITEAKIESKSPTDIQSHQPKASE